MWYSSIWSELSLYKPPKFENCCLKVCPQGPWLKASGTLTCITCYRESRSLIPRVYVEKRNDPFKEGKCHFHFTFKVTMWAISSMDSPVHTPTPLSLGWSSVASPPPISGTQTQPIMHLHRLPQLLSYSLHPCYPQPFPSSQIHVISLPDCSIKIVLVDAWGHIFVLCPSIFRLLAFCVSGTGAIWGA